MTDPRKRGLANQGYPLEQGQRKTHGSRDPLARSRSYSTPGSAGRGSDAGQWVAEEARTLASPGLGVCVLLCYLGLPPAKWKGVVSEWLTGVWEAYSAAFDPQSAAENYEEFKSVLRARSLLDVVKMVLKFVVEGKISTKIFDKAGAPGGLTVIEIELNVLNGSFALKRELVSGQEMLGKTAGKLSKVNVPGKFAGQIAKKLAVPLKAVRERLLRKLFALGVKEAALGIALRVVSKVLLVTDLAFAGICVTECSAQVIAREIEELTSAIAEAINAVTLFVRQAAKLLALPFLIAKASLMSGNIEFQGGLPGPLQQRFHSLILWLWLNENNPDGGAMITQLAMTPVRQIGPGATQMLGEVIEGLTLYYQGQQGQSLNQVENMALRTEIEGQVKDFSTLRLVNYLVERGVIHFIKDPKLLAQQALESGASL